jgi:cysteine desulfurase family protein (TIGR01976 family)
MPDEVIATMTDYMTYRNSNVGVPHERSRRSAELVDHTREVAARFLGCGPEEVFFGGSMTALNFALTRTFGRTMSAGDEILVSRLDHDANVAPWLELAHDLDLVVKFISLTADSTLDLADLEAKLADRTKVVAFPLASNATGTVPDAERIVELAHSVGALAWADGVHFAPHGPIDVAKLDLDVLLCSPYKFFGPHMGVGFGRREVLEEWRPYKVRPASNLPIGHRYEAGTYPFELFAGFVAAVQYLESVGWPQITAHERHLGARFLSDLPENIDLYGLPSMDGRVSTFCFNVRGSTPQETAERLATRDIAVYFGNYYAVEVMDALGLPDGAVRAGFVHYNTTDEVDRLLEELHEMR